MRNNRYKLALYDDRLNFLVFIALDEADRLVQRGTACAYQPADDRRCKDWRSERANSRRGTSTTPRMAAVRLLPPPPPASDSFNTPATLTYSDVLANVGLTIRPGGYISSARRHASQNKIAEFRIPSWIDLICVMGRERLENLPTFRSPMADIDQHLAREMAFADISSESEFEADFAQLQ